MGPAAVGAVLLAVIWLSPAIVWGASPVFVALDYRIPLSLSGCPVESAFRAMATQRLGYDPFREVAAQRVVVRAETTGRGIEGSLAWTDAQGRSAGEQPFLSASRNCADLVHAMTFAFVVQIQLRAELQSSAPSSPPSPPASAPTPASPVAPPSASGATPSPPAALPTSPPKSVPSLPAGPAPSSSPAPTTTPSRPSPSSPTPAASAPAPISESDRAQPATSPLAPPAPRDRTETISSPGPPEWKAKPERAFFVGLGSGLGLLLGPSPSFDGRVFAGARLGAASAEIGGEATVPTSTHLDDRSGFRYQYLAGTLALCGHLGPWSACGVGKLGTIRIRGFGVDDPISTSGVQKSAGARLALTQRLWSRISATAGAEWLASLTPWTVEVNHTTTWSTPGSGVHFGLDLSAAFE